MTWQVGDYVPLYLSTPTGDATTAVTAAYLKPDGTTVGPVAPGPSTPDVGRTWTAQQLVDTAGIWTITWTITGAGAGVEPQTIYVSAAAPVPWSPGLRDVADLIPYRTVPVDNPSDTPLGTFTPATAPSDEQVLRIVASAVRWVAEAVGTPIDPTLYGNAADLAAMRAAGLIELASPSRADDLNTADAWLAQCAASLAELINANTGTTGISPTGEPIWAMPPPYVHAGELWPYERLTTTSAPWYWWPAGWTVPPGAGPQPWPWE